MSRWRPPLPISTPIVTREGFEQLRREFNELWRARRPEVVKALAAAAAEGDRSENAEYIYRKKQLGEIDRRIRYLGKRLESLKVADTLPSDRTAIYFGAWFHIENTATGEQYCYRIVGPDEINAKSGWISIDSPLARAALRKRVDDEIEAELPQGQVRFVVTDIRY